jgi:hypothetical protein
LIAAGLGTKTKAVKGGAIWEQIENTWKQLDD